MTIAVNKIKADNRQSSGVWSLFDDPGAQYASDVAMAEADKIRYTPNMYCFAKCIIRGKDPINATGSKPYIAVAQFVRDRGLIIGCGGVATLVVPWSIVRGFSYVDSGYFIASKGHGKTVKVSLSGSGFAEFSKASFQNLPDTHIDPFELRNEFTEFSATRADIEKLSASIGEWEASIRSNMQKIENLERAIQRETAVVVGEPGTLETLEEKLERSKRRALSGREHASKLEELSSVIQSTEAAIDLRKQASKRAKRQLKELEAELEKVRKPIPMPDILKSLTSSGK